MRSRIWLLGMMCGVSGSAFAQEPAFMIPNDREASAQVAGILASARDAGLPTAQIVGKVNYGVNARRSKPNDIVRAASIVKTRLEAARAALAPNPSEREIEEGANALGENATAENLRDVRKAGGNRSVAQALGLLTQLLATKVPAKLATEKVTDLLRRGATGEQLVAMGYEITSDVRNGSQVLASLDVRSNNLNATLAAQGGGGFFSSGDKVTISAPVSGETKSGTPPPPPPRRP
jgi:hypothetical protein